MSLMNWLSNTLNNTKNVLYNIFSFNFSFTDIFGQISNLFFLERILLAATAPSTSLIDMTARLFFLISFLYLFYFLNRLIFRIEKIFLWQVVRKEAFKNALVYMSRYKEFRDTALFGLVMPLNKDVVNDELIDLMLGEGKIVFEKRTTLHHSFMLQLLFYYYYLNILFVDLLSYSIASTVEFIARNLNYFLFLKLNVSFDITKDKRFSNLKRRFFPFFSSLILVAESILVKVLTFMQPFIFYPISKTTYVSHLKEECYNTSNSLLNEGWRILGITYCIIAIILFVSYDGLMKVVQQILNESMYGENIFDEKKIEYLLLRSDYTTVSKNNDNSVQKRSYLVNSILSVDASRKINKEARFLFYRVMHAGIFDANHLSSLLSLITLYAFGVTMAPIVAVCNIVLYVVRFGFTIFSLYNYPAILLD